MQDCESNFIFVDFHICSADLFLAPPPTLEDQVDSKNKKGKTGRNWKSRSGVARGGEKGPFTHYRGRENHFPVAHSDLLSRFPSDWGYESIATVGEIRVWWRADFQSGSRVLKKVF